MGPPRDTAPPAAVVGARVGGGAGRCGGGVRGAARGQRPAPGGGGGLRRELRGAAGGPGVGESALKCE